MLTLLFRIEREERQIEQPDARSSGGEAGRFLSYSVVDISVVFCFLRGKPRVWVVSGSVFVTVNCDCRCSTFPWEKAEIG